MWGAEWMAEHHWDAIDADYVLTELGGWSTVGDDGERRVTVNVGEKGLAWRRLRVTGTPGHGSMPFGADNALVKAAEVVRRLADVPAGGAHRRPVDRARSTRWRLPDEVRAGARSTRPHLDDARGACPTAGRPDVPRPHAHDVLAERRPRRPEDEHDPRRRRHRRRHPHRAGHDAATTSTRISRDALGELYDQVEVSELQHSDPTRSESATGNAAVGHAHHAHAGRLSRRQARSPG